MESPTRVSKLKKTPTNGRFRDCHDQLADYVVGDLLVIACLGLRSPVAAEYTTGRGDPVGQELEVVLFQELAKQDTLRRPAMAQMWIQEQVTCFGFVVC